MGGTVGKGLHVAFATDAAYVRPTAVAVTSLVTNLGAGHHVTVHVVASGLTERHVATLLRAAGDQATLDVIQVDAGSLREIARRNLHGYPPATYYRLLLADLLDETVEQVIYLDGDVVVERNIAELAAVDLGAAPAACVGHYLPTERRPAHRPGVPYVNTGVMVMALGQWRARQLGPALISLLDSQSEALPFADQDAVNELIGPELHLLDPRWNQVSSLVLADPDDGLYSRAELELLRREPWIIHFSSGSKPWHHGGDAHPAAHRWHHYAQLGGDLQSDAGWRDRAAVARHKSTLRLDRLRHRYLRAAS